MVGVEHEVKLKCAAGTKIPRLRLYLPKKRDLNLGDTNVWLLQHAYQAALTDMTWRELELGGIAPLG